MDLKNLTPKDKELYSIMWERRADMMDNLDRDEIPDDFEEVIYMIQRAEYKRGKADGIAEAKK